MKNKIEWTEDYRVYEELPADSRVVFTIGGSKILVKIDSGTDALIISGDDRIAVYPKASNLVHVKAQP